MLNTVKSRFILGKKLFLPIILLSALFAQNIDNDKSYVEFKVRNMGVRDILGTITDMQGTVKFDSQLLDSSYFDVTVNVNTIDTENEKRDAHLKNEDFFETDKWPTIKFISTNISQNDSNYTAIGDLTIKDVTQEVQVPFSILETDSTIQLTGGKVINRLDYNVGVDYNNFKIGFDITVKVVCVVNKE